MVDNYECMFGCKPSQCVTSPLKKGDHPELHDTDLLGAEGIKQYQSLIGGMQWAVSLCRIDIMTAVMTMSSFCVAPCAGHLEHAKCI